MTVFTPVTPIYRFNSSDRLTINNVAYRCCDSDHYCHHLKRMDGSDLFETFTHSQVDMLLKARELKVDRQFYSPQAALVRSTTHDRAWEDLTDTEKDTIIWRKEYCDRFLQMEAELAWVSRSKKPMLQAIAIISGEIATQKRHQKGSGRAGQSVEIRNPPCDTTLTRWINKYVKSGFNPLSLLPGNSRSGNTSDRHHHEVKEIIDEKVGLLLDRRLPNVRKAFHQVKIEIDKRNAERPGLDLEVPDIQAVYRAARRLDPIYATAARQGIDAAKKKFIFSRGGLEVVRPFERLETDEWKTHLHVLLRRSPDWLMLTDKERDAIARIRCSLISVLDVATRCAVAAYLVPGSATAADVIRCLQMVVSDKNELAVRFGCGTPWSMHGRPDRIVHDGGVIYTADEVRRVINAIGAHDETAPAGIPELRGTIERSFRTIDQGLLFNFTGRTFSNVGQRGRYNSEKDASLEFAELNKAIVRWINDIYHNAPHEGLNKKTPYNAWLSLTRQYGIEPAPVIDDMRLIFGTSIHKRISGKGIFFMGMYYQSEALQMIRREVGQKQVHVKVDQADMGEISVEGAKGWISVPAIKPMAGTALPLWVAARRQEQRQNLDDAEKSWPIMSRAIQDLSAMGDNAVTAAGLDSPLMSMKELKALERDLFKTFRIAESRPATAQAPIEYEVGDDPPPPSAAVTVPEGPVSPETTRSNAVPNPRIPKRTSVIPTAGDEDDWSVD
ncbi:Mu transposase C-terminal domain-containing protein [Dongia sp.]|uniref:Mu transposase C-terminal domain-containing protein n=1 Tax=Dongia sp. TaxID=1977262 RepID=UPI0035B419BA